MFTVDKGLRSLTKGVLKMRFCAINLRLWNAVAAAPRGRRFSAVAHRFQPEPAETSPVVSQILMLLHSMDPSSWSSDPKVNNLLYSLSPSDVFGVTRQLQSFGNALQFFECLNVNSKLSNAVPPAFHWILIIAIRQYRESPAKLFELFLVAAGKKIPLSVDSVTLLIRCFGRANMLNEMMRVFDEIDEEAKSTDLLNTVLLGLLEWGRVDDALKLLDEMLQRGSCYPPNRNTVGIVFSSVLKRNQRGRRVIDEELYTLYSRFGECDVSPDGFLLTQIVTRFCRNSEYEKAWNILHLAMRSGSNMEVASCNVLLTALGRRNDFMRLNLLMKAMQENGIKLNVVTYGIMINHLCKFHNVDEALQLAEKMRKGDQDTKIEPDIVIFNTLIDGLCKVGREEEGLKLMETMRYESKCKPNTITYNCLIDGFCKAGDVQKGHELFEQMRIDGVEHNAITVNTLVDGMCKLGKVGSAMEFLSSVKERGFKGNAVTYSSLITAYCNVNNIDKALKLFDEMQEERCSPDAILYYSLISGLCKAGRMDDASFMVSKLKEAGFSLDIVIYNKLISGFCRKNKIDKAYEMVKDMEQAGVNPDQVTYNTLLSFFCAKGDFTSALGLVRKMNDNGLQPSVVTFGALIQAYCTNGNLEVAMKIFTEMCSYSMCPPNTAIYNMLIDAHCKNDDLKASISLMEDMKEKGIKANVITYNALFKGLQQGNWYEKAFEFMDQMTEEGCNPDSITMEILAEWLSAVGENEKLRKFVQGIKMQDFR